MPSIMDLIKMRSGNMGKLQMPGVISGFGGGTWNMDGTQQTPVYQGELPPVGNIPGYPPPEAYPIGNPAAYQPQGPDMTTEPQSNNAPLPESPGPSEPVAGSEVPHRRRHGIIGALESVFAPEPGSFWWSALNNTIFNAKEGQQVYRQNQAATRLKQQAAEADLARKQRQGEYQVVGNNVFHIYPDGKTEMITPPQNPGEQERLLNRWMDPSTPPEVKSLIGYMLKGAQYHPDVISNQAAARTASQSAVAEARAAAAERHRAPPKGATGGRTGRRRSSGGGVRLPAGAKIIG